jgi:hypothetical protein
LSIATNDFTQSLKSFAQLSADLQKLSVDVQKQAAALHIEETFYNES